MKRREFFQVAVAGVAALALPLPVAKRCSPLVILTTSGRRLSAGEIAEITAYFQNPPRSKFLLLASEVRVEVRS